MVNESSPVQVVGAPSQAERGDQVIQQLSRELERGGLSVADDSRIADAASWALEKATDALQSAALYLRDQASAMVARPIRRDPVRAVLIAAGVGALAMMVLSMKVRSGARAIERRVGS
jgi:ElaB/YqjD/DUF883 family membrane-anchored ribosome-binding protein